MFTLLPHITGVLCITTVMNDKNWLKSLIAAYTGNSLHDATIFRDTSVFCEQQASVATFLTRKFVYSQGMQPCFYHATSPVIMINERKRYADMYQR